MSKPALGAFKKLAGFLPALLLGDTRELIARIDERTLRMAEDLQGMKPKVDDMFPKVDILWKERIASARSPPCHSAIQRPPQSNSGARSLH